MTTTHHHCSCSTTTSRSGRGARSDFYITPRPLLLLHHHIKVWTGAPNSPILPTTTAPAPPPHQGLDEVPPTALHTTPPPLLLLHHHIKVWTRCPEDFTYHHHHCPAPPPSRLDEVPGVTLHTTPPPLLLLHHHIKVWTGCPQQPYTTFHHHCSCSTTTRGLDECPQQPYILLHHHCSCLPHRLDRAPNSPTYYSTTTAPAPPPHRGLDEVDLNSPTTTHHHCSCSTTTSSAPLPYGSALRVPLLLSAPLPDRSHGASPGASSLARASRYWQSK